MRTSAFIALNRVLHEGAYPDLALDGIIRKKPKLSPRDIALLAEIVYGTVRWLRKLDYVIGLFAHKGVKKKEVLNILRMGVYQLLFLEGVTGYAAINETVDIAKSLYGDRLGNFTNAVLREVSRNKDKIHYPLREKGPITYLEINYSFPRWLIEKWHSEYGFDYTEKLCNSLNRISPLTMRVNPLKTTREDLIRGLKGRGMEIIPTPHSPSGITFLTRLDPSQLPEFRSGLFTVQDEGAQLISYLLDPKPGEIILDACSAPGGKTTHIAELMRNEGTIIALDINDSRLKLVQRQARNLGINIVRTVNADAANRNYEQEYDKILVDAPCSGLGTIRRNPDAKWKKDLNSILELSEIQFKILTAVSRRLKPGGILVYAVCTLIPEENERVCERFLSQCPEFKLDTEIEVPFEKGAFFNESSFFLTDPVKHNMDGFFAGRFKKLPVARGQLSVA
ncbi:MAG TPA: 16S rRNA (cytosine(967)-C(5))-methyltransferase RsmB [Thermodesulfobacteriota bacterium]|nr:16S rRNA (cytosine(967)-C(5))-methyltransferase RsmB [Thermodesulfobacteriota bacterium]